MRLFQQQVNEFRQRAKEPVRVAETRWLDAGGDGAFDERSSDNSDTEHVVPCWTPDGPPRPGPPAGRR
eukprot:1784786-Heterocapsa_arctica.AAC.1